MTDAIIDFKDFSFRYESQAHPTLKNINLQIYPGEKICICGPSGSGKSTLLQCLNGLIPNQYEGEIKGQALVAGKDITKTTMFDLSFETGTVLQDTDSQFIGLTVAEDIAFALENDGVAKSEMQKRVAKWAKRVNLASHLNYRPQELSGGQKQRVSLAGVLIDESPLLLFDEPLANLDPASGQATIDLIDDLHRQEDVTVVIVEHRLEEVLTKPVDRVIVINDGQIVADLPPAELLRSDLLMNSGIREPLYVTALKYAGVDLNEVKGLESMASLCLTDEQAQQLADWQAKQPAETTQKQAQPLLEVADLSYQYLPQNPPALKKISAQIKQGEMLAVVGRNGAGKSTLFKALCGFITPSGRISWRGQDLQAESIKERADKIGYVMQSPNQMISKTMIFDEVALGLRLRQVEEAEVKRRVLAVLKVCGLYEFRNWPVAALSFGQKKRVSIASILVLEPELLILDEPTAGQDFRNYTEMMKFITALNQAGQTIVMITHDMHLMLEYAKRALVFSEGQLLADLSPAELLTNQSLIKQAALKETSLYQLAKLAGLPAETDFVANFINYEERKRRDEWASNFRIHSEANRYS